ncbi:MAG: serine hydrolase domain-containing protein, partial [Myxococcales bacterium]
MPLSTHEPDPPPQYNGMIFPGRSWHEELPEAQGFERDRLREAVRFLDSCGSKDGARELVIVRNGYLVWRGSAADKMHGVWSCTKSFTSTTLGLLIDDGKCTLDTRVKDVLPAMADRYGDVTLRHLTTMTSGYRAVGDEPQGSYIHGPSKTPFLPGFDPLFTPPGSAYAYWDSAMNQFANVLTRIAGEPLQRLFSRRIAGPIGIDRARWHWADFGQVDGFVVNGGSGNNNRYVFISALELARFGHLFLNRGCWKDRQLISEQWVAAATSNQVPLDLKLVGDEFDGRGVYGFNWWTNGLKPDGKRKWPGVPAGTFSASGHNNNDMFVIPEWKVVVVRL